MRLSRQSLVPLLGLILPAIASVPVQADGFSHDTWTKALSRFVDARGYVNYTALAADRADFDRYLQAIETQGPKSTPALFPTRNDQLAYYLNAYNAQVWKGVLARGPEKDSVWKGGLISGYSFFVSMKIRVDAQETSLKELDDDVIRAGFLDPRVHAALNCASKGCPRLPQSAFEGATLDQQLDAGMREFVAEARNVTVDGGTVTLSKIFDWFEGDFLAYEKRQGNADPEIVDYVNRYRADGAKLARDLKVKYFEYDKSVNAQ